MKEIIILELLRGTGLGDSTLRFLFWFAVPLARRIPIAGAISKWRGASGPENSALADGSVIEEAFDIQLPAGTNAAATKALLQARRTVRLAELTVLPNITQYYGTFFDGTAWSA